MLRLLASCETRCHNYYIWVSSMIAFSAYPKSVFFILANEFCERFSFYGMKALLTVYLIVEHKLAPSTAVLLFHSFSCLAYISPIAGSVLADSYFGRYKVILYVSFVYVIGHFLLSLGAIPNFAYGHLFDYAGLAIIGLSTGGIKPCVSAFAVDQFDESDTHNRSQFFSFFYFSINAGALLAILITPIFKSRVSCFGSSHCFPLAFGVPGVLMLVAFIVFFAGSSTYRKMPPSKRNVGWRLITCMYCAARRWLRGECKSGDWLSAASPHYSSHEIEAARSFTRVAILFSPIPFFWALFDQKGSTWILQARKLNCRIGRFGLVPEQINVLNPFMILLFVPLFEAFIYPLARKLVEVTSLRKMAMGGVLTAISFYMAGFLQMRADLDAPLSIPPQHIALSLIGNVSHFPTSDGVVIAPRKAVLDQWNSADYDMSTNNGLVLVNSSDRLLAFSYPYEKAENGGSKLVVLSTEEELQVEIVDEGGRVVNTAHTGNIVHVVPPFSSSSIYSIRVKGNCTDSPSKEVSLGMGSVHALVFSCSDIHVHPLISPNRVSILWMIPQYVVITMGEVLLSVTGLEFAYSQAHHSIKSIMQALWLMTVFLGNAIDIAISGGHFVSDASTEFFVYATLMLSVMLCFIYLAYQFTCDQLKSAAYSSQVPLSSLDDNSQR